jgi:hypothetical protein
MLIELSKGISGQSWGERTEVNISYSGHESVVSMNGKRKVATNFTANVSS